MEKSPITGRIRKTLGEKGLKIGELYRSIGIKSQTFFNWEQRKTVPDADTAIKMAEFLNVSVKWLILGIEDKNLTNEERSLVSDFQTLPPDCKQEVMDFIHFKVEQAKKTGLSYRSSGANA